MDSMGFAADIPRSCMYHKLGNHPLARSQAPQGILLVLDTLGISCLRKHKLVVLDKAVALDIYTLDMVAVLDIQDMAVILDTSPLDSLRSMNHIRDIGDSMSCTLLVSDMWDSHSMYYIQNMLGMFRSRHIHQSQDILDKYLASDNQCM